MEWNQLEYFRTVARLQHFTRAAKQLSISQPALSRSIANLEEELGFPLFERCGKNIALNRYGAIFLKHVQLAMQELDEGKQIIRSLIDPDYGTVSLAFLHSLGTNLIPGLLCRFRKYQPHIQFKLYQNGTSFLLEQLMTGEIDLCLCGPAMTNDSIEWAPLFSEELFIAVPANHRLATQSHIELKEIANEPVITFKENYGLRTLSDKLFKEVGIHPLITFEGEEIMTVAGLVEANLGVAMIPHIPGLNNTNITFLPISEPTCVRTIGVAWHKTRYLSPAGEKFKNFVIESFCIS